MRERLAKHDRWLARANKLRSVRRLAPSLALLAVGMAAAAPAPAGAAEPRLDVPHGKLVRALHCQADVRQAKHEPVLLVTGTGIDGSASWPPSLQPVLSADGHPSCYLDFPQHTTGDMQTAAEYVVFGIRRMAALAGRPIAVYGISQGGVVPRIALTYWPSLQRSVTDAVLLAGTQHGTTAGGAAALAACRLAGCAASIWQQAPRSHLLRTLNAGDETPGRTSYTTVRSLNDLVVQPQSGPHPTSALKGASNILVQGLCPGRQVDHIGLGLDTVSYAALLDAMAHRGPARAARFAKGVCDKPFAGTLDPDVIRAGIAQLYLEAAKNIFAAPKLHREPTVRFRRPR